MCSSLSLIRGTVNIHLYANNIVDLSMFRPATVMLHRRGISIFMRAICRIFSTRCHTHPARPKDVFFTSVVIHQEKGKTIHALDYPWPELRGRAYSSERSLPRCSGPVSA